MGKLSKINGKRSVEVIADLLGPLAVLSNDPDGVGLLSRKNKPEGMNYQQFFMYRVAKHTPGLMKNHESTMLSILSTINGVTEEEYSSNLTPNSLLGDVMDLAGDACVADLFFLAQSMVSSGSALGNTEDQNE